MDSVTRLPISYTLPAFFIPRYTRNLVDEGNGKFNVIILCWGEGQGRYNSTYIASVVVGFSDVSMIFSLRMSSL